MFFLNSLIGHNAFLEVMAKEECEILDVDKIIQFLKREWVEVGVNGLERESTRLSVLAHNVYSLGYVLHGQLYVFRVEKAAQEKDKIHIFRSRP